MYQLTVTATAEVRDKDGNLVNSSPVESVQTVTAEQARQLGLDPTNLEEQ
jgi:hypothetical protein